MFSGYKKSDVNRALKQEGVFHKKSITSVEFKRVIQILNGGVTSPQVLGGNRLKVQKVEQSRKRKSLLDGVVYKYEINKISNNSISVTLLGKHFTKNRVNSMSMRERMVLKTMIKDSATLFSLQNKKKMKRIAENWEKVKITYEIFNPKSRDTNATDLKTFRDTFTILGLIEDDNRDVIPELPKQHEIISKAYKVVATITNIEDKEKHSNRNMLAEFMQLCVDNMDEHECLKLKSEAVELNIPFSSYVFQRVTGKIV